MRVLMHQHILGTMLILASGDVLTTEIKVNRINMLDIPFICLTVDLHIVLPEESCFAFAL